MGENSLNTSLLSESYAYQILIERSIQKYPKPFEDKHALRGLFVVEEKVQEASFLYKSDGEKREIIQGGLK